MKNILEILEMKIQDTDITAIVVGIDETILYKSTIFYFEKWVHYHGLLEWQTPEQVPNGDSTKSTFPEFIYEHGGFEEFGERFILEQLNNNNEHTRHN